MVIARCDLRKKLTYPPNNCNEDNVMFPKWEHFFDPESLFQVPTFINFKNLILYFKLTFVWMQVCKWVGPQRARSYQGESSNSGFEVTEAKNLRTIRFLEINSEFSPTSVAKWGSYLETKYSWLQSIQQTDILTALIFSGHRADYQAWSF